MLLLHQCNDEYMSYKVWLNEFYLLTQTQFDHIDFRKAKYIWYIKNSPI